MEWQKGITKAKEYFIEREKYIKELKKAIAKYGVDNLPASLQKTIPSDFKIFSELSWRYNIVVRVRILQIGWSYAVNNKISEVFKDGTNN